MSDLLGIIPPEAFYAAVNISLFWLVGPIAAKMAKKYPAMSLGMSGLLIVNAVSHIAPFMLGAGYTPGTLTAIIIFVPASVWTISVCCGRKTGFFSMRCLLWYLVSSIIGHAVLMGSIMLFKNGVLGIAGLVIVQLLNALLIFSLWYLAEKVMGDKIYSIKSSALSNLK